VELGCSRSVYHWLFHTHTHTHTCTHADIHTQRHQNSLQYSIIHAAYSIFNQSHVQLPTSVVNVTLLAFADMRAIEPFHTKCQRKILGIRWHDFVRNSEISLRTGLAPVSDRITRGRNAIFGYVARLPDNIPAHQAMLRQVELSVGRTQTLHGNVHQVDHVPNGPTNSAATTTFPLLLVAVTRERRYGPRRPRVNDDDASCAANAID